MTAPELQPAAAPPPAGSGMSPALRSRILFWAGLVLFLIYGAFRQRYIWGVDSFGYFQLGKLFSEGRVFLPLDFPTEAKAALSPWGFRVDALGRAIPDYPPGFPLLLAIGHLVRAPLWVTPAIGVLSCWLIFQLLRERAGELTSWLLTSAWAVMPLTVYGSTMLMSDLAATTAVLAGYLAWKRRSPAAAAWLLGLSFMIRPTNVLFLGPLLVVLPRDRSALRLFLHLAAPCALYALYNHLLYGAPWRTGYGNVAGHLSIAVVPETAKFFLSTTWTLLTPILLGFAAAALTRPNRERIFLLLWALVFVGFYSFWIGGGTDKWWWARFILPGFPALFLLAADGVELARSRLADVGRWPALLPWVLLAILPGQYLRFGAAQDDLWVRTIGVPNRELVRQVEAALPPGALIGSLEHASSFLLYSHLTPFVSMQPDAPRLIEDALRQGRKVYVLPEPWNQDHPRIREILRRFSPREAGHFDTPWPNQTLFELSLR
jgi:hypothetical protein